MESAYNVYEYKDAKIYVYNKLKAGSTIEIKLLSNLPLLGQNFEIKGVAM